MEEGLFYDNDPVAVVFVPMILIDGGTVVCQFEDNAGNVANVLCDGEGCGITVDGSVESA